MVRPKLPIPVCLKGPDGVFYTHDGKFFRDDKRGWIETKDIPAFFNALKAIDQLYYAEMITLEEVNVRRDNVLKPKKEEKDGAKDPA